MKPNETTETEPFPPWLWPNLIGLDAPVVAVCWQWFFADVFQVNLPLEIHFILGLSVWCIYLADRLHDAAKIRNHNRGTPRLRFTQKHFRALSAGIFLLAIANLLLIRQNASAELIHNGLIVSVFVAIYYGLRISGKNRLSSLIPREIFCGLLFAVGTALATWTLAPPTLDPGKFALAALCFGLLCSANCILISIWEKEQDTDVNDHSIADSNLTITKIISKNSALLVLIVGALTLTGPWQHYLAISLAAIALSLLALFQNRLSQNSLRVLADAALLTPLVIILLRFRV